MAVTLASGRNAPVLSRQPERLVVEGYRAWLNGFNTGSVDCWEIGWDLYAREIGPRDARRLLGELSFWVRETRRTAGRPLVCFPYACQCLCRDECLLLALVAGRQNGDEGTAAAAARHIAGDGDPAPAVAAAATFAEALDAVHQRLLPVPAHVVAEIATRPPTCRMA
jgi:hypothetical protein